MRIHKEDKSDKKEISLKLFNDDGVIKLGCADEQGRMVTALISFYGGFATSQGGTKSVLDKYGYDTEYLEFEEDESLKVVSDQIRMRNRDFYQ